MAIASDVETGIDGVLAPPWVEREGRVVPSAKDIALTDGAVNLDATYLYADMADSTGLAQTYRKFAVAKIIRCYLNAACRLINFYDGEIRSFDGDRVMGIFIGGGKNTNALRCALAMSWAVTSVINPKIKKKWPDVTWTMGHGVGVDTGAAMLVRGGVRGDEDDSDIVSIGSAPNIAAKLSELRSYALNISEAVYTGSHQRVRTSQDGRPMWVRTGSQTFGGKTITCYGSSWRWQP